MCRQIAHISLTLTYQSLSNLSKNCPICNLHLIPTKTYNLFSLSLSLSLQVSYRSHSDFPGYRKLFSLANSARQLSDPRKLRESLCKYWKLQCSCLCLYACLCLCVCLSLCPHSVAVTVAAASDQRQRLRLRLQVDCVVPFLSLQASSYSIPHPHIHTRS